ncbi:ATP-dependent Clp protease proteolytic subunit, partial [Lactococcus lactis]|uniref:ATP-dependent Clp protease proteolytic subunit n=2 Tax=Lactococcus lactis TaxID=1358 RepID=UPI00223C1D93
IHNVWSVNQGDYRDMAKQSDVLKEMSSSIAKMYAKRMGCTLEEAQAAMDEETYYSADQAVEAGIADEKSFEVVKTPLQMMASMDQAFSSDKIAKLKNFMKAQIKNETNNSQEFKLDSEQYQGITDRLDQLISFESEEPNEEPVAKKSNNSADKPLKNQLFKFGGIK